MRKLLTIFSVLVSASPLWGQEVISAGGHEVSTSDFSVVQTVGELIIPTASFDEVHVTQGFNQPTAFVVNVEEISSSNMLLYPNPAVNSVVIEGLDRGANLYEIWNLSGMLIEANFLPEGQNQLSIAHLASGVYWIRIRTDISTVILPLEVMR